MHKKQSAIQRELDFVVIINNIDEVHIIENKVHSSVIKEKVNKSNFIILNRLQPYKDLYEEIDDILFNGAWCDLNPKYLSNQNRIC